MTKKHPANEDLTYEQAFVELESIVSTLEIGEHTLDEAITQFERGQVLTRHCASLLEKAELKVQQLSGGVIADFDS